jgi:hypothetical protein
MRRLKHSIAAIFVASCVATLGTSAQTLKWSQPVKFDTGVRSSVAMNSSGLVLEVHRSPDYSKFYYHVGHLRRDLGTVDWGKSQEITTIS